jgi:hypothetical protein
VRSGTPEIRRTAERNIKKRGRKPMEKEAMERDEKETSLRLEMRTMIFRHGWSAFMGAVRTILQEAPSYLKEAHLLKAPHSDGQPRPEKEMK